MDERQTQVVSGAGLQESRINTEFVDFLSKWGPRGLYVLLAIVLCFLGYQQWTKFKTRQTDQAYADYEGQIASRNPDLLLKVAEQHVGQPTVWALATRDAANILVVSATMGTNPGADLMAPKPEDIMSPDQRTAMFQKAQSLFQDVLNKTKGDPSRFVFAQQARWGIASTLLSQGKNDEARKVLEEFVAAAEATNHDELATLAKERINRLNAITTPPMIVAEASLPDVAIRGGRSSTGANITFTPGDVNSANSGEELSIRKIQEPTPQDVPAPETPDTPLPETEDAPAEPAPAPANPGAE